MTRAAASPILHLIRRVVEDRRLKDLPDQELLRHFLAKHDQAAFDALLRRHGSMVLDVCRNVLGNEQDAEDAFQATFLVLAQKAGAVRNASSVGSWLYGVAYRTAIRARTCSARRRKRDACIPSRTATPVGDDLTWREVQQVLHAELNRLPERHRAPLVHCYLEGKSQADAAQLLGVPRTTLQKRLDAGRALLRTRLVRQGLGPAATFAVWAWPSAKASAPVPLVLLDSTAKAASLIGAGEAVKSVISPKVVALMEGVLKAMFLTKLKVVSAVVLGVLVGTGLAGWSYRAAAQTGPQQVPRFQLQQQGQQEVPSREERPARPARHAERPAADELDALRLEIDALRREVRADRERIRALEAEVRGPKEQGVGMNQIQQGERVQSTVPLTVTLPANQIQQGERVQSAVPLTVTLPAGQTGAQLSALGFVLTADHFAEAEAALKRLRLNPHDKQAADALDKAVRLLKAGASAEGKSDPNSKDTPARQH
jgi:RNA polymerase sigma factor (sigma-70 family)